MGLQHFTAEDQVKALGALISNIVWHKRPDFDKTALETWANNHPEEAEILEIANFEGLSKRLAHLVGFRQDRLPEKIKTKLFKGVHTNRFLRENEELVKIVE